jgi:pimeloyl-ACP methyl ester carboxylesterase
MSAYVLVHGGVHGAWCWETVIGPPTDAGHHVQAIDLPGRNATAADASHCTLSDYVKAIGAAVGRAPEPPVLVGHSMGGASTSQFAERHSGDIKEIVYLSAVVPRHGESAVSTLLQAWPRQCASRRRGIRRRRGPNRHHSTGTRARRLLRALRGGRRPSRTPTHLPRTDRTADRGPPTRTVIRRRQEDLHRRHP